MTSATTTSFAFQPWARKDADDGALKDVLARVNLERGHFRDITEASLQEEIAAEGALELSESESEADEDEDGEVSSTVKDKPTTREDLFKAKAEMLTNIRAAEQEVWMSLDFISLLLSKDAPKQANSTISPYLKESVPLGSLGTDVWQRMPVDQAGQAQDELLAVNVRMQGLQQSADSLLTAATRLQNNVQKETQYWSQILSISEEGWNVCRIPGQQHRLGVSFGFSESARTFSQRGIAELIASSGGSIMLERALGSKPKCLRIVILRNGDVVGTSKVPQVLDPDETTLEARIRYARDSLFDEELYHEMIRESRTIASLGVEMKNSSIELGFAATSESEIQVSMDLVSLDQDYGLNTQSGSEQDDALAQAILLAARLLLSQAHRDRSKSKANIAAPLSEKQKGEKPVLPILRPIMSLIMHRAAMNRLNAYLETVANMFENAHIKNSHQLATYDLSHHTDMTTVDTLVMALMQPWISEASLSITDPTVTKTIFEIKVETTLAYGLGSAFTLSLSPGKSSHRYESIDEFVDAADWRLGSTLTKSLAVTMDSDWKFNEREALIIKDVGVGEKSQSMWVGLDSKNKVLSLNSITQKVVWKLDGSGSEVAFWEAKNDVF